MKISTSPAFHYRSTHDEPAVKSLSLLRIRVPETGTRPSIDSARFFHGRGARRRTSSQGWPNRDTRWSGQCLPRRTFLCRPRSFARRGLTTFSRRRLHWRWWPLPRSTATLARYKHAVARRECKPFWKTGHETSCPQPVDINLMGNRSSCVVLVLRRYEGDVRTGGILMSHSDYFMTMGLI